MSWKRIRGHDARVKMLELAWRRNRLAHAYLFAGPEGVGKKLFARELAKTLLCEGRKPDVFDACDACPACAQVEAGTHPDYFAAGRPEDKHDLPIEVMQGLCAKFSLKSARGKGKVVVLDDADDLNDAAANCFLKTLEEPPSGSVLILIGSSPELQLATIVSRCQVVRFAPLPDEVVADLLHAGGVEAGAIPRLVRLAGGSPGQATALAAPELWEFRRALLAGLGKPAPDGVALARAWKEFVESAGKESAAQRRRASLVLRLLIEFLDDVLRVRLGGRPRSAEPAETDALRQLADRYDSDRLLALLERCLEGDDHIDRKVQLVLALEALVDGLTQRMKSA
jgi:DNA polymerase III subunit delta'